jgi:glucose-1-phosphate thymidylyltransferase
MKVLILAAGYATRLYPRTRNFPKPLLKVNRKPIIQYLIEKLDKVDGISEVIVVTNSRFYRNFAQWKKKIKSRNPIVIVNDLTKTPQERLGAVGDMDLVFRKNDFEDDFLVLGGDNFFQEPLGAFVKASLKNSPSITLGVRDIGNKLEASHFGVVSLGRNNLVTNFQEKPKKPGTSLIAMCLYYFPKQSLGLIREYLKGPKNSCDAAGSYIRWLTKRSRVYSFGFKNFWFDIGHIYTYEKVKRLAKGEIAS